MPMHFVCGRFSSLRMRFYLYVDGNVLSSALYVCTFVCMCRVQPCVYALLFVCAAFSPMCMHFCLYVLSSALFC